MGKYRPGCILFVYNGASVPWITCVNNFRYFTNISETMLPPNMYYISLEKLLYSTSARVSCITIDAEIKELLQVKDWDFYIHCCLCFLTAFSHSLFKYSCYLTHISYKMVDNKSTKTSLFRHTQKHISLMKINNITLVLRTCIILLSSLVIFFFLLCHSGSFPILSVIWPMLYSEHIK